MNVIDEIEDVYFKIDDDYAASEFEAHSEGRFAEEDGWRRKRELNTHAYFLFLFTRLEDFIVTKSKAIVVEKMADIEDSVEKIIWDINLQKNLHFKKRLELLTKVRDVDYYERIVEYYQSRNEIAHGGTITDITIKINMIDVFSNMKLFYSTL